MFRSRILEPEDSKISHTQERLKPRRYIAYKDWRNQVEASKRDLEAGLFILIYPLNIEEYNDDDFLVDLFPRINETLEEQGHFELENEGTVCLNEERRLYQNGTLRYSVEEFREFAEENLNNSGIMIIRIED